MSPGGCSPRHRGSRRQVRIYPGRVGGGQARRAIRCVWRNFIVVWSMWIP